MEIWKDIKGYEGKYQVSNLGRVKSLERKTKYLKSLKSVKETFLKERINRYGYVQAILYNDKPKTVYTHRLVAIAFIPNTENKSDVNHKNGIKIDNREENLEWATRKENINHSFEMELSGKGQKHGRSKLTEIEAKEIKYGNKNLFQSEIAEKYGITQSQVSRIRLGKLWNHI